MGSALGLQGTPQRRVHSLIWFPEVYGSCAIHRESLLFERGPKTLSQAAPICAQATDNPTASSMFTQRLKTLRDKDGFRVVLFSSHVRKVRSGQRAQWPQLSLKVSHLLLGLGK